MNIRFYLTFIAFIVWSVSVSAGTVKGVITDKKSGEPIPGAIVMLDSSNNKAISGLDGTYVLSDVSAGIHVISTSFPLFTTARDTVNIADANATVMKDFRIMESEHTLSDVVVSANHKNGSDEQARSMEKNSDFLMNIMSARMIELGPDINAAEVLQRVSGVVVQRDAKGEAKYATIRGMDKRYNYTTVDGIKIPSPNDKMRYVPLNMFPTEMVDRIEVVKSLTPNMEGDAIGGVVNLKMKDAPDHLVIYAGAGTGYNENLMDQKYDYFFKGGLVANDPRTAHGPNYNATPHDFSRSILYNKNIQAPADGVYNLTIGNRYLKDKRLGVILSGSYHNLFKATNSTFFNPASQPGAANLPEFDDIELRRYSVQEVNAGVHTKIDYNFNEKNTISLYGMFVQLNQFENRQIIDTTVSGQNRQGPGLGNVSFKDRTSFTKDKTMSAVLEGNHVLIPNLKFQWKGAISKAQRDVPDLTSTDSSINIIPNNVTGKPVSSPAVFGSLGHSWQKTTDQDEQIQGNLTYSPTILGEDIEFMGGGFYRHKERTDYYNDYSVKPLGTYYAANLVGIQDSNLYVSNPLGTYNGQWLNYNVHEDITAGYVQAKFLVWQKKLQIITGVRVENTQLAYNAPTIDVYSFGGTSGSVYYTDVLPSLHLKYKLSNKENIRASYFRSISRPGYFEMVPYSYAGDYYTEVGNTNIDRSHADNYDLRYEWFPKGIDQVLLGAFYKNIQDPIEYAVDREGKTSAYALQPINEAKPATNYGFEAVITKYFHYWGISANYTYTQSAITTTKLYNAPNGGSSYVTDTVTQTRPLQGQAAHVANIALMYKNPKLGFNAHLSWQYTGRNISFVSAYSGLDYWNKATSYLALSVDQMVAKHVQVYAKVNNILNFVPVVEQMSSPSPFKLSNGFYLPYQTESNAVIVQRDVYGRSYLVGIRYKLD